MPSVVVPALAATMALLQAAVLCALAARGSWYTDDLDFLAEGRAGDLSVDYLTLPVNDHLVPGLRLVYWGFAHGAPLDYRVTVAFRGVLLLTAALLMYRLLVLLLGRRWIVLAPLAVYLALPVTVPSFLSLSSAVNLLPSHIGEILLLDATVRYAMTRRLRWVAVAGAALAGSLLFWEKSGLVLATAAVLVVGFLLTGSLRQRLRAAVALWPLVACWAAVAGAAAVAWTANGAAQQEELATWRQVVGVLGTAWFEGVGPLLVGGPWTWLAPEDVYLGVADPGVLGVVLGQLAWVAVVVVGLRRTGRRSLAAWLMVAAFVVGTSVLVGLGRAEMFGNIPGRHYHYWSDLAVTITVALVCAWTRLDLSAVASRALDPAGAAARRRERLLPVPSTEQLRWPTILVVAVGVSASISVARLESRWVQNPTGPYVETLAQELRDRPEVALYDAPLPPSIVSFLSDRNMVSDLVSLVPGSSARFDSDDDPQVVADDGRLVPGRLQPWGTHRPLTASCGYLLNNAADRERVVVRLQDEVPPADWTIRVGYLANPDARVRAEVQQGVDGEPVPLRGGEEGWPAGLTGILLRTHSEVAFDRLVLTALDDDVNVCIGDVTVGLPEPRDPA